MKAAQSLERHMTILFCRRQCSARGSQSSAVEGSASREYGGGRLRYFDNENEASVALPRSAATAVQPQVSLVRMVTWSISLQRDHLT